MCWVVKIKRIQKWNYIGSVISGERKYDTKKTKAYKNSERNLRTKQNIKTRKISLETKK